MGFATANAAGGDMAAKCAAVETFDTCFASKSAGCSAQVASMMTSQINSAKAQLSCSSGGNSGNNDNTANGETTSSSVVTVDCDTTGLQQCVTAFSTGVAGATDMGAKCQVLNTFDECLTSKSAGCSAAQQTAFVAPVESAKTSLHCDESLSSNAPLMLPNVFAMSIISGVLVVVSLC